MKLIRKLHNPFALVVQGFAVGAALFLATHPGTGESIAASIAQTASVATGSSSTL
jgi:hypothetical protein